MNRMFSAKFWMMIATTGMVLSPAFELAAQTNTETRPTKAQSSSQKTPSSQKALKSAVQRELEKYYLRDGKTPPTMTTSAALKQLSDAKAAEQEKKLSASTSEPKAAPKKRSHSFIQKLSGTIGTNRSSNSAKSTTNVKSSTTTAKRQTTAGAVSSSKSATLVKKPAAKKQSAKTAKKADEEKKPGLLRFGAISRARLLKKKSKTESKSPSPPKRTVSGSRRRSYANSIARRRQASTSPKSTPAAKQPAFAANQKAKNQIQQTVAAAQQQQSSASKNARQSEIQQRLAELYKRDGREMPPMKLSQQPGTQSSAAVPSRDLQKKSPAAASSPKSKATASTNNRSPMSFLKRLLPGRRNRTRVPAQRVASQKRQPAPVGRKLQPAKSNPPKVFTPPAATKLTAAKKPQRPVLKPAIQTAAKEVKPAKDKVDGAFTEVSEAEADKVNPFSGLTLNDKKPKKLPAAADQKTAKSEVKAKQTIKPLPDIGLPKPVAKVAGKKPSIEKGKKPTIQPKQNPAVAKATEKKDKHADKYKKIAERTDKKGLKGFCIVALRDRRELADTNSQFKFDYNGKTYQFSSSKDRETFVKNPAEYAPVAGGNDVTLLAKTNVDIEGTLDHAVWYKGRLYLFSSKETMEVFVANPSDYVLFE